MPRTTEEDLLWARSGKRPVNIVRWGPYEVIPEPYGGGRLVKSQAEGKRLMVIWKRWYERKGWKVHGNQEHGFLAWDPEIGYSRDKAHTCHLMIFRRQDESWVRDYKPPKSLTDEEVRAKYLPPKD